MTVYAVKLRRQAVWRVQLIDRDGERVPISVASADLQIYSTALALSVCWAMRIGSSTQNIQNLAVLWIVIPFRTPNSDFATNIRYFIRFIQFECAYCIIYLAQQQSEGGKTILQRILLWHIHNQWNPIYRTDFHRETAKIYCWNNNSFHIMFVNILQSDFGAGSTLCIKFNFWFAFDVSDRREFILCSRNWKVRIKVYRFEWHLTHPGRITNR